jgi:heat shock 70kDa protein 4
MCVVGIDFGAQSTKIGVARNKGIDIVSVPIRDVSMKVLQMANIFADHK